MRGESKSSCTQHKNRSPPVDHDAEERVRFVCGTLGRLPDSRRAYAVFASSFSDMQTVARDPLVRLTPARGEGGGRAFRAVTVAHVLKKQHSSMQCKVGKCTRAPRGPHYY
jgi:hypothetical protein